MGQATLEHHAISISSPGERGCPQLAVVRAVDAIDAFWNIVGQQLVDAAVKIWVVLGAGRKRAERNFLVSPQKIIATAFSDEIDDTASNTRGDIDS
jgi:hypothetical protein